MNSPDLPREESEPAIADWVERHGAYLRGLARALVHDPSSAADLEQDTWRAALEHRGSLGNPRAWLAATAKNLALTKGRGERRRRERERRAARPEASGAACGPVDAGTASLDAADLLQRALRSLDEPFKGVVVARYLEGLEPKEIAERDGTPIGTVKSRLKRGLRKLREGLDEEHGGERSAWCGVLAAGLLGRSADTAAGTIAAASSSLATDPARASVAVHKLGGLLTAAAAMKLTLLLIVPVVLALFLVSQVGGEGPPPDLAAGPRPEETVVPEDVTLGDLGMKSADEVRGALQVDEPAEVPQPAAGHTLSLRVLVLDDLGRPAPGATVAVAPPGHPFNVVGFTGRGGELDVHWESQASSAEVDVQVRKERLDLAGIRRVQVTEGASRRLVVSAPLHSGSKYNLRTTPSTRGGRLASGFPSASTTDDGRMEFRLREPEGILEDFEVADSGDEPSGQVGTISGTILNGLGRPVAGYAVSWCAITQAGSELHYGKEHAITTSADGRFVLEAAPGSVRCTAGPVGNEQTLDVQLRGGETLAWNPVISHASDVLFTLKNPTGGDVDSVLFEATYDDGETLWVKRTVSSETGQAVIYHWPQPMVDLALIAPEKIAAVPVVTIPGIKTGSPVEYTLPKDEEVTVLRVNAALGPSEDKGAILTGIRVFDEALSKGAYVPVPRGIESFALTLPEGVWNLVTDWSAGAPAPPRRVIVAGDQPIELGMLAPPQTGTLVLPERSKETPRWTVHLCMEGFDSLVHDASGTDNPPPSGNKLSLPPGRYRVSVTQESGEVQTDEFELDAGATHELKLP